MRPQTLNKDDEPELFEKFKIHFLAVYHRARDDAQALQVWFPLGSLSTFKQSVRQAQIQHS